MTACNCNLSNDPVWLQASIDHVNKQLDTLCPERAVGRMSVDELRAYFLNAREVFETHLEHVGASQ